MRRYLVPALLFVLFAGGTPARADSARTWVSVNLQAGVAGPLRVQSETIVRSTLQPGIYDVEQGTSLGYRFDKTFTYWIGYVYSPVHVVGHPLVRERRLRQQVNVARIATLGPVRLSGRARLETRWQEQAGGSSAWRLRPQVRATLPLRGRLAINLSNETFLNLTTNQFQRAAGIERMRTGLTLSIPVVRNIGFDAGYVEQHVFVRAGPDIDDHIGFVGFSASF